MKSGAHRDDARPLRLVRGGEPEPVRPPKRPALDDAEILAAVRRGDPTAATALHDRVRNQIDRTITRLLGRHDAEHEELAQAALTELVMTIDRFRGECSLDHWTARITSHAVYNELRRRRRARRVFSREEPPESEQLASTDLERDTVLRDLLQRVRACLDRLDPNKAWTLMLHDVCGHDLNEIAEITAVSVSAAQTRLVRGRRELRELLENEPELEMLLRRGSAR